MPWAHVDIAGVSDDYGRPYASKGGSGFGVRLLVELARANAGRARPALMYTSALAEQLAADLLDRFLRYARVDTQSAENAEGTPSTPGQFDLARMLVAELEAIGLEDAAVDEHCYVTATLPGAEGAPVVGLLAHLDVSPDAPGAGVEPLVHRGYDGGVLKLPRGGTVLDPATVAELGDKAGHDVVTSSGDTLLGADDKAGVAEIMAAVAHLMAHPELPRPTLRIGFTPDEEVAGAGAKGFDVAGFGAACAYTLDGSTVGEVGDETFTGSKVTLTIHGVDIHTGWAKGKLVNAAKLAARILGALPADTLTPETTDGRQGFIHPYGVRASAVTAVVEAIVRDYEDELLEAHVALLRRTAEDIVASAPGARLEVAVEHQYPNLKRFLERAPQVAEVADRAVRAEGLEPVRRAEPRRHRRLHPERRRPADAEPVHRRPRVPLGARVGVAAGHGDRGRGRRAPRGRMGADTMDFDLSDDHELIRRTVRDFAEGEVAPVAEELDRTKSFPYEIVRQLGELGLMGIPFPEEYGGGGRRLAGLRARGRGAHARGLLGGDHAVRAHLARHAADLPVRLRGAEARVDAASSRRGRRLGAFGLTEPEAGSDAGNVRTRARLDDGEWVIDGAKQFITNAGTDISGVVCITRDAPATTRSPT